MSAALPIVAGRLAGLVGAGLLLVGGEIACRAARLRLVAAAAGHRLSAGAVVRVTLLGDFAAAVTPANVGGEPARLLALRRLGLPWADAALALAAELATDVIVLVMMVSATALCGVPVALRLPWPAWAGAGLALVASGAAASRARGAIERRAARALAELRAGLGVLLRGGGRGLGLALVAALGHGAFRFAVLPALAAGLGIHVDVGRLLAWQLVAFYGLAFTPLPGGVGATEAAFLLYFEAVPLADRLHLLVAWRLASYAVYFVAGGVAAIASRRVHEERDPSLAWRGPLAQDDRGAAG